MHRLAALSLVVASLAACSSPASSPSSSSSGTPCPDAGLELDAAPVDAGAGDALSDVDAGPCALRVDSLEPSTVRGGELVTMRGCGFVGVRDVEINVTSVAFVVVDDSTIVFPAPTLDDFVELPFDAPVDVIRRQPDQVQARLTYR